MGSSIYYIILLFIFIIILYYIGWHSQLKPGFCAAPVILFTWSTRTSFAYQVGSPVVSAWVSMSVHAHICVSVCLAHRSCWPRRCSCSCSHSPTRCMFMFLLFAAFMTAPKPETDTKHSRRPGNNKAAPKRGRLRERWRRRRERR